MMLKTEKWTKLLDFLEEQSTITISEDGSTFFDISKKFVLKNDELFILEGSENKSILQEAEETVNGDRAQDYGDMQQSFDNVAKMWSVIAGKEISARQVGLMMAALKIVRENNRSKRDNLVDLVGYALCTSKLK